jgi:hypothetical protein
VSILREFGGEMVSLERVNYAAESIRLNLEAALAMLVFTSSSSSSSSSSFYSHRHG